MFAVPALGSTVEADIVEEALRGVLGVLKPFQENLQPG
jgi:hypothetical protein